MHYVLARITVKSEAAEAAAKVLTELAQHTRKEDADAHMATPHVGAAFAAAGPLLAGAPEILAYNRVA